MSRAAADTHASALTKLKDLLSQAAAAYDTMVERGAPPEMLHLIRHNLAEIHLKLGEHYLAAGQVREAAESGRQACLFRPDDREAAMLSARALLAANDIDQALSILERASLLHAADAGIQSLLAQVYLNSGRAVEAVASFRRALEVCPGEFTLTTALANALAIAGQTEDALSTYRDAIAMQPGDAELQLRYGLLCNDSGALGEARATFGKLICMQPGRGLYHRLFGTLHRYNSPGDPHILHMESLISSVEPDGDDARDLHFALFNAYERLRDYDRAFAHLGMANEIRRGQLDYRPEITATLFDNIQSAFEPRSGAVLASSPREESPIFVVGMPCSGSPLAAQILGNHPAVSPVGETPAFAALVELNLLGADLAYDLRPLDDAGAIAALGNAYLAEIGKIVDPRRRTLDRYLSNFLSIGIIKAVFPQARIVHCHRDPLATCFSAYASAFETKGLGYKADMQETARYYVRYHRLMQFWKRLFGEDILDLSYERLTLDPRTETLRLLDYCGLDRHPACLDVHKTSRMVKTTGYEQIRQPLYRGVERRTGHYLQHLGPMIEILQAAGIHPA